jgi:hypothetical protein
VTFPLRHSGRRSELLLFELLKVAQALIQTHDTRKTSVKIMDSKLLSERQQQVFDEFI